MEGGEGVVAEHLQGPPQYGQQVKWRDLDDLLGALRPCHTAGPDDLLPTDALARDEFVQAPVAAVLVKGGRAGRVRQRLFAAIEDRTIVFALRVAVVAVYGECVILGQAIY